MNPTDFNDPLFIMFLLYLSSEYLYIYKMKWLKYGINIHGTQRMNYAIIALV